MAVALAVLTLLRHRFYMSGGFDLGFYLNSTWQIAHGNSRNSIVDYHVMSDHLSPVLVPLSAVWATPWPAELLLLIQAAFVGAGVIPAHLLGRTLAKQPGGAVAVVWYTLSATIWYAVFFDLHVHLFGLPVLLWMMWRVEDRPTVAALAIGEIALVCFREDVAILGAIVVAIAFVRTRRRSLLAVAGLGALIPVLFVLFGKYVVGPIEGYAYVVRYGSYGSTPSQIAVGVLTHPGLVLERLLSGDAMALYLGVLAPMLFLCILGWRVAWPGFASMFVNLIADDWHLRVIYFQYHAAAVPFLLWGSLVGFRKVVDRGHIDGRMLLRLAIVASVIAFVLFGPIVGVGGVQRDRRIPDIITNSQRTVFDEAIAHAPPDAELSASFILIPRLAGREHIYNYPFPLICSTEPNGNKKFEPEYILLAVSPDDLPDPDRGYIPQSRYELVWAGPGGELWKRRGASAAPEDCPSPLAAKVAK